MNGADMSDESQDRFDVLVDTDPLALRDLARQLEHQRDQAVRAARKLADHLGVDWVDHPLLSQPWAIEVPS